MRFSPFAGTMNTRAALPRHHSSLTAWLLGVLLPVMLPLAGTGASLRIDFAPVAFDSFQHRTSTDQTCSVTRLDFILSEIALKKPDGSWIGPEQWSAYLSLRDARDGFTLKGIPEGKYEAVKFHVGVRPDINKADVTKYPANHPLNPTINTLWWGWAGGFVFLAIEGGWRRKDGSISGYSYHVATDRNLMTVELPCQMNLMKDLKLKLKLDPVRILDDVTIDDERSSTHSRGDDEIATKLRGNIEKAFGVLEVAEASGTEPGSAAARPKAVLLPGETLLPFTYPANFPQPALPGDNPLTVESVALGKSLFSDRRLSINDAQSCADCHLAANAFADPRQFSIGAEGQAGTRNAMPLFNLAWKQRFFWDGRAPSLRDQVLRPIQDPNEMHETLPGIEKKFGLTSDRIARALEQYLLTLVSSDARIDRVMRGQEKFTEQEQRGFDLFHTEYDPRRGQFGADCFHCHGGPLFQSMAFANNGLDAGSKDAGLMAVTNKAGDNMKFAVPSLRNIARTAPYMHDGRFKSLEEVIDHYDHGIRRSDTLDPNLAKHPAAGLGLSKEDKSALLAFLHTLTDDGFGGR